MSKLAIGPIAALYRFVSREFWTTLSLLAQLGWNVVDTRDVLRHEHSLGELLDRRGGWPDVVLFWEWFPLLLRHADELRGHGAKIYVMTDDLHHRRQGMEEALRTPDGVLATYGPRVGTYFPDVDPSRVTWVPHAAGPDFLFPIEEHPHPVVFVSGAMGNVYPLRGVMRELAVRRPELARLREHPGYDCTFDYSNDPRVGRAFAADMRECLAAFTDALSHQYVVAKHFEIPATGALLLADRTVAPQLAALGFNDGEHYVSTTADDLESIVERVLDPRNLDEVDTIRRRGHTLVHACHTTMHRARQIDAACT